MIRAYVGNLGAGKTYNMVADARDWLKQNRGQVYSNMAGFKCPEAIFIGNLSELTLCQSGLLVLDEASVSVSARFFSDTSREVLTRFAQLRKHGMDLFYTTQSEDRVDKVLREITNESIYLRKVFGGFRRRVYLPGQKEPISGIVKRLDKTVFDLYDTMEVISTSGGSLGRATGPPALSRVASLTQEKRHAEAVRKALRAEIPALLLKDGVLEFTPAAAAALRWLKTGGHYRAGEPLRGQLQAELVRRRWLSHWHLSPDDAPVSVTPGSPWLEGYDPQSVLARLEEREALEQEIALREAARNQAIKAQARKALGSTSFKLLETGELNG